MSKHTPGPWTVEDRRHAPLKNIRVVSSNDEVCEVSSVHQRDYQGGFRGDHKAADAIDAVGIANARLIAAAPDLLAACKELMHCIIHPDDMSGAALDRAESAIAMALNNPAPPAIPHHATADEGREGMGERQAE